MDTTLGGCASCVSEHALGQLRQRNALPSLALHRVHRYRDMTVDSSYGPGVFQTFDTKLYLTVDAAGERHIEYFDPLALNSRKFTDGSWSNPWGCTDVLDGIYTCAVS
ncbi:MAG: hypothetical protein L6R48_01210 [Planctomycetes bacterium]|nr:hypothetical protein [Planctomycetota bacterium]